MASTTIVRKSARIPVPDRWDLTDLVKDPVRQLQTHLSAIDVQIAQIEAARDRLSPDLPEGEFAAILRLSESVAQSASRLGAYAYLWFSENTKDGKARSFKAHVVAGHRRTKRGSVIARLGRRAVPPGNHSPL